MKLKSVDKLQKSKHKIFFAVTGGGTEVIPQMLKYGGGSKVFLGSFVPYANEALSSYLGYAPPKYCSRQVAKDMAMTAYHDAKSYSHDSKWSMGVGVTASLMKAEGEREGRDNKIYIALQTKKYSASVELTMGFNAKGAPKSLDSRPLQEEAIAKTIINFILYFDSNNKELNYWNKDMDYRRSTALSDSVCDVILGNNHFSTISGDPTGLSKFIFPGSFNPIHKTHVEMMQLILDKYGLLPDLEISIENVDKCSITHEDITSRLKHIKPHNGLIDEIHITRLPKFIDKASYFQGCTFIIGTDTMKRLVDLKYYDNLSDMRSCLKSIVKEYGCRFIVFEREGFKFKEIDISFIKDKKVEEAFELFEGFIDKGISSTQIREKNGKGR